jgi:hypothetical protein
MIDKDALFIASDFRANMKQVIAKRSDLARFDGGRMVPSSSGTTVTYYAGQVLGVVTATGLYKPYASANSDGSQVAVGVLAETCQVDDAGNGSEISIIKSATLLKDLLIGLDSGAITNLQGKSSVEHGTNLLSIHV